MSIISLNASTYSLFDGLLHQSRPTCTSPQGARSCHHLQYVGTHNYHTTILEGYGDYSHLKYSHSYRVYWCKDTAHGLVAPLGGLGRTHTSFCKQHCVPSSWSSSETKAIMSAFSKASPTWWPPHPFSFCGLAKVVPSTIGPGHWKLEG